ncbi:DUF4115 domain-containing protein [Pseudoalteromonas tunicata]|uniref:RodZ domain-containing protein n=1 Tax=Pseudoalteromonas tunicata TaxID=314281 RepID=UPI00273F6870|nr:RodZ domain-containing protein [Pseudoalteromonas tunicata]MDP5214245.1 DUF4115 domain-containing protein [Pseudoalteromonas tunicata]
MIEQEVTDNTVETPLPLVGSFLTAGREAAKISVDEFAKRLNLSAAQLTNLESNQFALLGPATFVKGYIKSYCKFLSLDESYVLSLYDAQTEGPTISKMQSFSRRTEKEAHDNRLMLFSYAVLSLVIGLSVLWWWQNRDNTPAPIASPEIQNVEQQSVSVVAQDSLQKQPVQNQDAQLGLNSEQITNELSEQTQVEQSEQTPESTQVEQELNEATQVIEPVVAVIKKNDKQANNSLNKVVMYFNNDSWVEIFDSSAARVAFGVKKAGYTMTVEGKAPFAVVVGKPHLVEVEFDGEQIDMSKFPSHRLAKFSLPLTE